MSHSLLVVLMAAAALLITACNFTGERATPASTPTLTVLPVTPTPSPTITPTPTMTPIPTRNQSPVCAGAPSTRMILHERGRVTDENAERLNIRSTPGTSARVLALMRPGETFLVLDGPSCADGYTWYFIRFRSVEGWVAEGDPQQYYVEPYLPG